MAMGPTALFLASNWVSGGISTAAEIAGAGWPGPLRGITAASLRGASVWDLLPETALEW